MVEVDYSKRPNGNGAARFFRANAGVLGAFALFSIAFGASMWAGGIIALPQQMEYLEGVAAANQAKIEALQQGQKENNDRLTWIICTTVPPNTRRELRALQVDCGEVDEVMAELNGATGIP